MEKITANVRRLTVTAQPSGTTLLINVKFISSKLPIISVEGGGEESWISDDSCDDVNNNQLCNYDGGDCCGANVIKQYCIDCDCLSK